MECTFPHQFNNDEGRKHAVDLSQFSLYFIASLIAAILPANIKL